MGDLFLEALANAEPVPGGGAAAAHGACVGLALLEKILRLEIQRKTIPSGSRVSWVDLREKARNSSRSLLRLRDEDSRAYISYAEARTSGKGEEEVVAALKQAIECPIKIMEEAHKGLTLVSRAGKHCKVHLLSDLLVVCELLRAAINGAYRIALANLQDNPDLRRDYQERLNQVYSGSRELFRSVESLLLERARVIQVGKSHT